VNRGSKRGGVRAVVVVLGEEALVSERSSSGGGRGGRGINRRVTVLMAGSVVGTGGLLREVKAAGPAA
jgi:hypothetical protein